MSTEIPKYTVTVNGDELQAVHGQSLLALFVENEIFALKSNQVTGEQRFGFCGMGICFDCEVLIDDKQLRRACMINIEKNLKVTTGDNHG